MPLAAGVTTLDDFSAQRCCAERLPESIPFEERLRAISTDHRTRGTGGTFALIKRILLGILYASTTDNFSTCTTCRRFHDGDTLVFVGKDRLAIRVSEIGADLQRIVFCVLL